MAKVVELKVVGFKELDTLLKSLPGTVNRKIVRSSLLKGSTPIAKQIRSNLKQVLSNRADREDDRYPDRREGGRQPGNLVASIKGANIRAFRKYASGRSMVVLGAKWAIGAHAHILERGKHNQPPRPFMRPAWDAKIGEATRVIHDATLKGIQKEVKKIVKPR